MALLFGGVSDYLSQATALLANGKPSAWACWYKPTNNTGAQTVYSVTPASVLSYYDMYASSGVASAIMNQNGQGSVQVNGGTLTAGSWNHLLVCYRSATALDIYVNGVKSSQSGTSITTSGFTESFLGALNHGGTIENFANGAIAYPCGWNGFAPSDADAATLYNSGSGSDPRSLGTPPNASFSLLQGSAPFPDAVSGANWTVNGSPTVVADPFSLGTSGPTVTTSAATSVTASSATLNGNITNLNGGGNATAWGFQVGLTTAYGTTIQSTGSVGTGTYNLPITGLAGGITYHARAFATNSGGTGNSSDFTFTTSAQTKTGTGEVLYDGPTHLSSGTTASGSVANLFDGYNNTTWTTSTTAAWAGIDVGAAVTLTRFRYTAQPRSEDLALGALLKGDLADSTFATPTTLATLSSSVRPNTGTLLNEVVVSPGASYRYYMAQSATGLTFGFADLDFIGGWASGIYSEPVAPVLFPPGGNYDKPTVVTITSLTLSATIYYTTDGSTPTNSSTQYTGPFVVSTSAVVKAIAYDQGLSTPASRTTASYFIIPSALYSHQLRYDDRNYYMNVFEGHIMFDPVSGYWFNYGSNTDASTGATLGLNIYRSADLRNWKYMGNICGLALGSQLISNDNVIVRPQPFYCPATGKYVIWLDEDAHESDGMEVWTSSAPDGSQPWTLFTVYDNANPTADGYTLGGFTGDIGSFVDPSTGNAYLVYNYGSNSETAFSQLDPANFTNTLGTNKATYADTREGHGICYHNGKYFWVNSGETGANYNVNEYGSSSAPIGPWSSLSNPFQTVSGSPPITTAYNSQTTQILFIPGRNALIWIGDDGQTASGANQQKATQLMLPMVFPTSTTLTISWQNTTAWPDSATAYANGYSPWSLDTVFPTVSGAPLTPSGVSLSSGVVSWTNTESNPVCTYLDYSSTSSFSSVISEVVSTGVSVSSYTPIISRNTGFYRIRQVNANGTSVSAALSISGGVVPAGPSTLQQYLQSYRRDAYVKINGVRFRIQEFLFTLQQTADTRLSLIVEVQVDGTVKLLNTDGSFNSSPVTFDIPHG